MVKIICRIKPPKEDNIIIEDSKIIKLLKKERNLLDNSIIKPYEFELDKVYDYNINTNEIFDSEIKNKINKNIGIFIYGHTGSGKTYTLFGNKYNDGIFDLLCKELNYNFVIKAIDIRHCGNFDLFNEKKIFEYSDKNENIVSNSSEINVDISNYDEIKEIIYKSRISGTSKYNNFSSRSHLIIYLIDKSKNTCYNIIDLAGNERKPSITNKENEKEVQFINSSLLALKECFRSHNKKYVPYRRSDLTRLLKNILTNDSNQTNLIICTIHSGFPYFHDSVDTLNYIDGLFNKVKKYNFNERNIQNKIGKKKNQKHSIDRLSKNIPYISEQVVSNDNSDDYSDDFYSEPDINGEYNDDIIESKYIDDWDVNPIVYSPSKKNSKQSNRNKNSSLEKIFSKNLDPIFIDNFASIDNNILDPINPIDPNEEEKIDDIINLQEYISLLNSNKNPNYKKKLFGIINNFAYKNCITNYKELLDKNIDDNKISILILNNIALFKVIIKELKSI